MKRRIEEGQVIHCPKEKWTKGKTTIYKTLHRKIKIQHTNSQMLAINTNQSIHSDVLQRHDILNQGF